ncbi:MAG: ABC transporter ATP-binding protein, partial [Clostridia bacterium]|nr:ABC transporter ATP-binding protein [Clostridia bacterium]
MLKLTNIVKSYLSGSSKVEALKDVSIEFRKNEFVSILGPSGCGKTTLLNIIGGLDRYDSGDLSVNNRSTKDFDDSDWDSYRNHSIGFVFQSYNLIPHQTVLSNVELALTLSGVSKQERRKRAKEALEKVGLSDQLHKKPNQMSGGQMQRVAIARALVNDPEILLADEPTGALDSETSVQIMEILKEISKEKLIIMVTHNPEIAEEYSTRIVRLLDGRVTSDSNPYESEFILDAPDKKKKSRKKAEKTSMSFMTALSLSLNNLMTKKARTFMTSFAGSIGIIGIALIMSISNGVNAYINRVQEDTLSSYPITIQAESVDMTNLITNLMGSNSKETRHELDAVYSNSIMYELINTLNNAEVEKNNLNKFKKYLENDNN